MPNISQKKTSIETIQTVASEKQVASQSDGRGTPRQGPLAALGSSVLLGGFSLGFRVYNGLGFGVLGFRA